MSADEQNRRPQPKCKPNLKTNLPKLKGSLSPFSPVSVIEGTVGNELDPRARKKNKLKGPQQRAREPYDFSQDSDPKRRKVVESADPCLISYRERKQEGLPLSPSPFDLGMPPSRVTEKSLAQAKAENSFRSTEEYKKYMLRRSFFMLSSFKNSLEYFHEYIMVLRKTKATLAHQIPEGQASNKISASNKDLDRFVFFLRQCEDIYKDMAIEKGYDPEIDPDKLSATRKFRTKWFPRVNALRLLFGVRIANLAKDACVVAGSPISQGLFVHLGAAFSWTPFIGWLFYLPRILVNIITPIKNTQRARSVLEAPKDKKKGRCLKAFLNNLSERTFENANDWVWMVIGLITCFCVLAAVLTPLLYLYDVGVEIVRSIMKIKMWTQHLQYAYANALAKIESISDIENDDQPHFLNWELEGAFNLNDLKGPEESIEDGAVECYQEKVFLKKLYHHIVKKTLETQSTDVSLNSLQELHKRAYMAWSFHVSMIGNRASSKEGKGKIKEMLLFFKRRQHLLKQQITSVMRLQLKAIKEREGEAIPYSDHRRSLFHHLQEKCKTVKKGAARNITLVSLMAVGMLMTFVGGGHAIFNIASTTMPAIPVLTLVGIAIVVIACSVQIAFSYASPKEDKSIKYG